MKKFFLFLLITILCFINCDALANESISAEVNEVYEEFTDVAKEYDSMGFVKDAENQNYHNNFSGISEKIYTILFEEFKISLNTLLMLLLVCTLTSVLNAFVCKTTLSDVGEYGIYCICSLVVISSFKLINDICTSCIDNLSDFMDIAVPTYIAVLSGCGYGAMAVSMQSLFMLISLLITHLIKGFICPLLFCCGIVSVVAGFSKVVDLSRFIKLISKTIKYILGIIMTIFAGVITFSGFSASASDSLAAQTARFAVANFLPVVGGCLSSALNGLKQSSILLKNNMGYVGFLIMISLCIVPLVKIMVSVFSLKLGASMVHLFSESKLGSMLDSVCEVLVTLGALVVFVAVVFILIIGVISSVG